MSTSIIADYPELLGVLPLSVLLAVSGRQFNCPEWLAQPARYCLSLAPAKYLQWTEAQLTHAGFRSSASFGNYAAAKVYSPLAAIPAILVLPPYAVLAVAGLLFFAADAILSYCVRRRQREIRAAIPQMLDLMTMCIDAGLSLDSALQKIGSDPASLDNAFHDELKIVEREILLGMDRALVYEGLFLRTGVDELKSLGSALNQASKLGLSIAKILRSQAEFLRNKLSQKAEEKAMKTPIYMAFPLWLFIMPSLLLLVLGPSLIRFYHQVGSVGGGPK
jgi:tight adherence protein C